MSSLTVRSAGGVSSVTRRGRRSALSVDVLVADRLGTVAAVVEVSSSPQPATTSRQAASASGAAGLVESVTPQAYLQPAGLRASAFSARTARPAILASRRLRAERAGRWTPSSPRRTSSQS